MFGVADLPPSQQGIVVLGTPLGDPALIQAHLDKKAAEQRTLLERILVGRSGPQERHTDASLRIGQVGLTVCP